MYCYNCTCKFSLFFSHRSAVRSISLFWIMIKAYVIPVYILNTSLLIYVLIDLAVCYYIS